MEQQEYLMIVEGAGAVVRAAHVASWPLRRAA